MKNIKRKVVTAIVVFIICLLAAGIGADNKPEKRVMNYIAVIDLDCDEGINKKQCAALTEVLIGELTKVEKYTVIDRANRDKILGEAGFQMTGCIDESCTIEVGKILGVGKIVVGSITKLGSTYLVNLQLLNVETATVETFARETCKKCELDSLIEIVSTAAKKLLAQAVSTTQPTTTEVDGMVIVPAGEFSMGCEKKGGRECPDNEMPAHKVYLDAFYIDKFEVTVDEYELCVKVKKCKKQRTAIGPCTYGKPGKYPVNCVSWNQAKNYCAFAEKRLPTEAEWEKAARGTDGRMYPWGNEKPDCSLAVFNDGEGNGCGKNYPWPVGSKPKGASPYGAMDMAGNVWEWTADRYGDEYYKYSPAKNPKGPGGKERVPRGGGWDSPPENMRPTTRRGRSPNWVNRSYGIRCAKSP